MPLSQELNDALRSESTWSDVSSGLGKILLGYFCYAFGVIVAGACVGAAIVPLVNNKPLKLEHMWMFYIGAGIMKVTGLFSWITIMGGKWRCLMNTAERYGAKWVIFFCITCVFMAPILSVVASFAGVATPIRWTGGPDAFRKVKFTMTGLYLLGASGLSFSLCMLSFWYYLATVARCMGASRALWFIGLFIVPLGVASGLTGYWLFGNLHTNRFNDLVPFVGLSWLLVPIYWVAMIVVVKRSIDQTIGLIKNPLEYSAEQREMQLAHS